MTLIASMWSPEGFAIVADGLQILEGRSPVVTKTRHNAQKIFFTPFINQTGFAFGWAGATAFNLASGTHISFVKITEQVMESLPDSAYLEDAEAYFGRVARNIFSDLPVGVDLRGQFDAEVMFVGYLRDNPLRVEITFSHTETKFLPPTIKSLEHAPLPFKLLSGSKIIAAKMEEAGLIQQPLNLSQATEMVRRYAQVCIDSNQSIPDCANLGGQVSLAHVTPQGCKWINPPFQG